MDFQIRANKKMQKYRYINTNNYLYKPLKKVWDKLENWWVDRFFVQNNILIKDNPFYKTFQIKWKNKNCLYDKSGCYAF